GPRARPGRAPQARRRVHAARVHRTSGGADGAGAAARPVVGGGGTSQAAGGRGGIILVRRDRQVAVEEAVPSTARRSERGAGLSRLAAWIAVPRPRLRQRQLPLRDDGGGQGARARGDPRDRAARRARGGG